MLRRLWAGIFTTAFTFGLLLPTACLRAQERASEAALAAINDAIAEVQAEIGRRNSERDRVYKTLQDSEKVLASLAREITSLERGEFINDLSSSKDTYSIVKAVIKLCHILSLEVIAEGVETEEQHTILKQLGCNYFQGYYFDKPMEVAAFTQLINKSESAEECEKSPHLKVVI